MRKLKLSDFTDERVTKLKNYKLLTGYMSMDALEVMIQFSNNSHFTSAFLIHRNNDEFFGEWEYIGKHIHRPMVREIK